MPPQHSCKQLEIIKELTDKIVKLEIKAELSESNMKAVKEDINDMKGDIKEISKNVENGFKNADKKDIAMLTGIVLLLVGVVVDILTRM